MKPLELTKILKNHKVYVQTHNYPDPDAIASAFGLQYFLKQHGIDTIICYDGKIEKLSTKKMFDVFGIRVLPIGEIRDMQEEDYIVVVDAQKFNANITDFVGDEIACIDHHPTYYACDYQYKDIRDVGACASIIASYFKETDTPISPEAAAALAYGIKMDTADFTRGATPFDAEMFAYVFERSNANLILQMYRDVMEFADLKAYGAAIDNVQIYDRVGFAQIPFDCPDALVAIISDFILALDVVTVSVVYALRPDGIKFSVRSEVEETDAGDVTKRALAEIGSGGGHKEMAGGFIPTENRSMLGEDSDFYIRRRFLDAINHPTR
ncbi:MAG: DHH family phosphoesterase [Lachnospiraceae bacterium]|nr:DHH family phosphoesterase [Lachnospiraceae bacterium]